MTFKERLREVIFNYIDKNEDFDFEFLGSVKIKDWPQNNKDPQDLENCSVLELTDEHILIHCSGDWQKPMEIKIKYENDSLICTENKQIKEFQSKGINKYDFLNMLFDKATTIFPKIMSELKEECNNDKKDDERKAPIQRVADQKLPFEQYLDNNNYLPHPVILRKINTDTFPFNNNLFFGYNSHKLGAIEFNRCVDLLMRRNNNLEGGFVQAGMLMDQLLRDERPNAEELQDLAIKLVREMYNVPDSIDLKAMLEMKNPDEECCDHDVNEDEILDERKRELQPEVEKRRILNTVVHGCAVYQWTSAYHIVRDELNAINPILIEKYNKLSALVNYWNWKVDSEPIFNAGQKPMLQGINNVDIKNKEISASAMNFPVLIHELSKGVMDYLVSAGIPKEVAGKEVTEDELKYIYNTADNYAHECWHYFFGPTLWKSLLDVADVPSQNLPPIISKMAKMNYAELSNFCIDVIFDPEKGKKKIDKLTEKTI